MWCLKYVIILHCFNDIKVIVIWLVCLIYLQILELHFLKDGLQKLMLRARLLITFLYFIFICSFFFSVQVFFINQATKITTFIDPRLPINDNHISLPSTSQQPPIPPPRPTITQNDNMLTDSIDIPTAYNEKVVAFIRQPNILEILAERYPQLSTDQNLKDKINHIRIDGISALDIFGNELELTILLR